jgi:Flp pilus assembly protein TadG
MTFFRDERGQVLVFTVLCMMILIGFLAFATDVGMLFYHRRTMQSAADAAALAGALEIAYTATDGTTVAKVAQDAAALNGYTDGTGGVTIAVNNPPSVGPHAAGATAANYVEAVIRQPVPTVFMGLFHMNAVPVTARAVAGATVNPGCVWTLGRTGSDITLTGSGSVSIPNCDIYDDSNSAAALTMTGSGNLVAAAIGIVGRYFDGGGQILNGQGQRLTPKTGIAVVADPLSTLQAPTGSTGGCQGAQLISTGTRNLTASCYASVTLVGNGGVTFSPGDHTINGNFVSTGSGPITLGAGTYVINGDLNLSGGGALNATNVGFYVTGAITVTGTTTMNLSAPVTGPLNGILFFQARADTQPLTITGSSLMNLQGIIYAPGAALTMTGGGSTNIYTDLIVSSATFTGATPFQSYANINSNSPLSKSSLVE